MRDEAIQPLRGRNLIRLVVAALATAACSETGSYAIGELAYVTPSTVDELQTLSITARCHEENPIIGPCAEHVSVGIYFFGMIAVHAAISWALPPRVRAIWQSFTSGMEAKTAIKNWVEGYRPF